MCEITFGQAWVHHRGFAGPSAESSRVLLYCLLYLSLKFESVWPFRRVADFRENPPRLTIFCDFFPPENQIFLFLLARKPKSIRPKNKICTPESQNLSARKLKSSRPKARIYSTENHNLFARKPKTSSPEKQNLFVRKPKSIRPTTKMHKLWMVGKCIRVKPASQN